ncbi:ribosome maturation factor RimM [Clostridium algidicarnis]|uniref:ribosome maturation factor RimM n=1 Tax=Clostridium algidicarnis TaxID=37659 RepID=UPI0004984375|nr:ribosome maturation factor RimM [Clostridium algidicarnis]MBB6696151.1 16S rRNA processing protein RimM [Clostridium algidicarnis]MBU3203229.1 ribosome maturation factor RimM [Clostridium algidicarnis]MBU3205477.1 ribosome maturation factor RimM [Clostridium algidicarnis]MBU3211383.1 ribosome maturation factor RimM [Clostridium algidicarnis]MBU3222109.1 ribosome maturation factor RimM [Clostridium algidicarnis]
MEDYLSVGQISKPHGIKGEVKVIPLTDDIKRFRKLKKVYIDGNEKVIVWCKMQVDRVILKIEGIDTMEGAESLRNKYIQVKREEAVRLPKDSYFIADLLSCTVYDTSENKIGKVYDVIKTGSNDVYWIKDEKEILIPALKDIVLDVDIDSHKIIIRPIKEWQDED